jgi:glycosyltransferase involved in cell wall biosynthesis
MGISGKTKAKAFESSAWRHCMYGRHNTEDGNPLDTVIPNFYRPDDFSTGDDQGYLLFIGRITRRKGVADAVEIARQLNRPLIVAGQGGALEGDEFVGDSGHLRMDITGLEFSYEGVVGPDRRRDLYAHASCSIVPTLYIEPFGGVFAEAMLSGIMPVCRDWGAFVEYVPDQARFSTVEQGVKAVSWAIGERDHPFHREQAIRRFSTATVAEQFSEWLGRIRSAS